MPVIDRQSGESLLLSAAHVVGGLARSSRESAVYTSDAVPPTPAAQVRIGTTIDSVPDELVEECKCDAALVRPVADVTFNRRLDRGSITRYIRALGEEDLGATLHKRGCTTGETRGEFWGMTDVPLRVRTSPAFDVLYSNVLSIMSTDHSPFALPGDSGAVVVDANNDVVGLIVGMEDPTRTRDPMTFAIPIETVLGALDIDL